MSRVTYAVLQGAAVAAWIAVPDYVSTVRGRRAARAGWAVGAGLIGALALPRGQDHVGAASSGTAEKARSESEAVEAAHTRLRERLPDGWWPWVMYAAAGAVLGLGYGINRATDAAIASAAAALGRRGVPWPNTLLGVGLGIGAGVLANVDDADGRAPSRD